MTGKQRRKGDGRVAFLANADKFRELLNAGHPQRSIYDDYAASLGISYSQFNRYVGKYLLAKEDDHGHQTKPATGGSRPQKPVPFAHDPNSDNDPNLI